MAEAHTATLTFTHLTVPGDSPLPVLWYAGVRDTAGTLAPNVQEQIVTTADPATPVTMHFTGIPPGTWEVWAGQRASDGTAVGEVVKSVPFVSVADVVISVVATITVTKG